MLELPQEVEQGGLDGRDGMDRHAQVKGLEAATAGIAVGEGCTHLSQQRRVVGDGLTEQEGRRILDRLPDLLAARDFPEAGVARVIRDKDDITSEERAMRTAQVEQHAVVAGDRHDTHRLDQGRRHGKEGRGRTNCG